jgi:hypothetical protein
VHDADPDSEYLPTAQPPAVALTEPAAAQKYPALQSLHTVAPGSEYLPAGQMLATGFGLVEPAGHAKPATQLLHVVAPA